MRLTLIAIILFLILTLGNAYMYRKSVAFFHRQDYAAFQLPHRLELRFERDLATWREVGAAILTVVVFGGVAYFRQQRTRKFKRSFATHRLRKSWIERS